MDNNKDVEIERLNGEIKLIHEKITNIRDNHLFHIERDISRLNKLAWTIGVLVFTQLIFLLRDLVV
tara:strand:- start:1572 stop:1769 length:198 start_codon:yes stop_codon:yes gene_type:complete